VKVGDLVKKTEWTNIEYSPTETIYSLGIIVSHKDDKEVPGAARIGVVFSDGKEYVYAHDLEIVSEGR
jgi:hypothetical protein